MAKAARSIKRKRFLEPFLHHHSPLFQSVNHIPFHTHNYTQSSQYSIWSLLLPSLLYLQLPASPRLGKYYTFYVAPSTNKWLKHSPNILVCTEVNFGGLCQDLTTDAGVCRMSRYLYNLRTSIKGNADDLGSPFVNHVHSANTGSSCFLYT